MILQLITNEIRNVFLILVAVLLTITFVYYIFFAPKKKKENKNSSAEKSDETSKSDLNIQAILENLPLKEEVQEEVSEEEKEAKVETEFVEVVATVKLELEEEKPKEEETIPQEMKEVEEKPKPKRRAKELGNYHVTYRREDKKWLVKRAGSETILRTLETQAEAIAWATIRAINQDVSIVIHKRDGKIRKQSY